MQTTSAVWKALWAAGAARLETRATIAGTVYTQMSNPVITRALTQNGLNIGNAVSATCQVSILTEDAIPRAAAVVIEQRLNDGTTASEWLPAGTFYISRRTRDAVTGLLNLECYDALLKANALWEPASSTVWPQTMGDVATALATLMDVTLDSRTSIRTGAAYVIEKPDAGTTIHDVLGRIAAANGGNWIITPAGKLRLVPVVSAAGAASATENAIDVVGVTSAVMVHTAAAVTGIRYQTDDEPVVLGNENGIVIEADVGAAIASDLYDALNGVTYQAYSLNGAIYDPAAEMGDYVRGGANGEVSGVLYAETAVLAMAFRGDISAPESGEMADEYPYIGASAKALTAAKVYAAQQVAALDGSLDQTSVFNRLTGNGAAQGLYIVNGQLYVNMSYARSGTLILGGLNNSNGQLQVQNSSGNVIGSWDVNGLAINEGSFLIPFPNGNVAINQEIVSGIRDALAVLYRLADGYNDWKTTIKDGIYVQSGSFSGGVVIIDTSKLMPGRLEMNGGGQVAGTKLTGNAKYYESGGGGVVVDGDSTTLYENGRIQFKDKDGNIYFNLNYLSGLTFQGTVSLGTPLDISSGGTGASTAAAALAALGGQSLIKVAESEWVNFQGKSAGDAGYQAFALDTSLSGKTILGVRFYSSNLGNSKGLQLSVTGATSSDTVNVNYFAPNAITSICNVKMYVYYC